MLIRQPTGCWGGESESDYPNKKDLEAAGRELTQLHQQYHNIRRMRDMERAAKSAGRKERQYALRAELAKLTAEETALESELFITYGPTLADIVKKIAKWKYFVKTKKADKIPDWVVQDEQFRLEQKTKTKDLL